MITSADNSQLKLIRKLQRKKERDRDGPVRGRGRGPGRGCRGGRLGAGAAAACRRGRRAGAARPGSSLGCGQPRDRRLPAALVRAGRASCRSICMASGTRATWGRCIRSAHALGDGPVVLGPGCADPFGPKAVRASMGSLFARPPARADFTELEGSLVALDRRGRGGAGRRRPRAAGGAVRGRRARGAARRAPVESPRSPPRSRCAAKARSRSTPRWPRPWRLYELGTRIARRCLTPRPPAEIRAEAEAAIAAAATAAELEELRVRYLGRKAELTTMLRSIKDLPADQRGPVGKGGNEVKVALEAQLDERARDAGGGRAGRAAAPRTPST